MSDKEGRTLPELKESFNNAIDEIELRADAVDAIKAAPSEHTDEELPRRHERARDRGGTGRVVEGRDGIEGGPRAFPPPLREDAG